MPKGRFFQTNDPEMWITMAKTDAEKHVEKGKTILVAKKGNEIGWRYPSKPDLVPDGWEFKEVVV